MENKSGEPSRKALRKRTILSFAVFILAAGAGAGLWIWVWNQPLVDEARRPFRTVLELNGKLWHALFGPNWSNQAPPPPAGKRPRFNGNLGLTSAIDLSHWRMEVVADDQDEKSRRLELTLADVRVLPKTETSTEFKCIEGWSDVISYAGVRFSDFLKMYHLGTHSGGDWDPARPPADTYRYVGLETPDGEYYVSIDMESMLHSQTLLAYEMNGKALDLPNGAPLRLIIPVKYGIKSLKRIGKIFFSDRRPPDYWAEQGYDWFAGL